MANNVTISKTVSFAGVPVSERTTLTAESVQRIELIIPAAKPGDLTTRTDDNTGTLTMDSASHGITTGARLDLYWAGGKRRGMVVGTVSGTSVPIDLGSGDVLPAALTEIVAMVPVEQELAFIGNNLVALVTYSPVEAQFVFADGADAELLWNHNIGLIAQEWYEGLDPTNPLAGDIVATLFVSHADTSASKTLSVGVLHD